MPAGTGAEQCQLRFKIPVSALKTLMNVFFIEQRFKYDIKIIPLKKSAQKTSTQKHSDTLNLRLNKINNMILKSKWFDEKSINKFTRQHERKFQVLAPRTIAGGYPMK